MGLPEILIEFKAKAETAVRRSENGIVAVILRDDTKTGEGNLSYKYQTMADYGISSQWTTANRKYLSLAFAGAPKNVLVERIGADETYDDALARLKNKKWKPMPRNWQTVLMKDLPLFQSLKTPTTAVRNVYSSLHAGLMSLHCRLLKTVRLLRMSSWADL